MPGSNPTFAETIQQYGKAIKAVNEAEKFGGSNATNLVDMEDAFVTALDGEFTPAARPVLRNMLRNRIADALEPERLRELWRPFMREILRYIGSDALGQGGEIVGGDAGGMRRIRQYMVDNSRTFNSRGMTLDTSSTGSPTGSGSIHRLTVDKDNKTLECTGAETKTFVCTKDQTSGVRYHDEEFELRFANAAPDGLYWSGSGGKATLRSLNAKSAQLLVNPSWESGPTADNTALTSTTQLTGWSLGTASNIKTRSAAGYYFRGYPGTENSTLWGLEFVGNDTLAQVLRTANSGVGFDDRIPYFCGVRWMRKSSATGNLTLHLGSQSELVTIGSGTNDVWNHLFIPMGTKCWYPNFKEDALDVKVQVASLATGTVVIDDLVLAPMSMLDGTWWAIVGGATPWTLNDTLAYTDVDGGTRAILSYWLWRTYRDQPAVLAEMRGWFPTDNAAGETDADPV